MLLRLSHKKFTIDNVAMCKTHYQLIRKKFINNLHHRQLSNSYIEKTFLEIGDFYKYLYSKNIFHLAKLTTEEIYEYLITLDKYSQATKYGKISHLRNFFRFLYTFKFTKNNLVYVVPKIKVNHNNKIPNATFSKEELNVLLNSIDKNTHIGKRDYAITILMVKLGIRFADIKNLKFENINWKMNTIQFVQTKTKKVVTLPLLNDIGIALIDYIKNGRPNVKCKYIFLDKQEQRFSNKYSFSPSIKKYLGLANIDISNKKYIGTCSLRRSLATTLLQKRTPLSIISGILGHSDMNNTSIYLKVDIPSLRECCLDLEVN